MFALLGGAYIKLLGGGDYLNICKRSGSEYVVKLDRLMAK